MHPIMFHCVPFFSSHFLRPLRSLLFLVLTRPVFHYSRGHRNQEMFPYTRFAGTADAAVVDGYVSLGFAIKRGVVDPEKGVEGPLLVSSACGDHRQS